MNHRNTWSVFAWVIIVSILGLLWFDLCFPDMAGTESYTNKNKLLWEFVNLFLMFFLYVIYKRYCILWHQVTKSSIILYFYESIIVPSICIFLPLSLSWYNDGNGVIEKIAESKEISIFLLVGLFAFLSDIKGKVRNIIEMEYTFGSEMDHMLMGNNPPKTRSDIFFFDVGYNLLPFLVLYFF